MARGLAGAGETLACPSRNYMPFLLVAVNNDGHCPLKCSLSSVVVFCCSPAFFNRHLSLTEPRLFLSITPTTNHTHGVYRTMSLPDLYQRFLADPRSASLASDVSLIYIPTTTKVDSADAVRSHLSKQQTVVKTKAQDVLGVVEGPDAVCLDIETTLEFVNGGGAYLPSLDDNFLTDRVVSFPTVSDSSMQVRSSHGTNINTLLRTFADPYRPLRWQQTHSECSHLLGSGVVAETGRGYRLARSLLAHSRRQRPDSID